MIVRIATIIALLIASPTGIAHADLLDSVDIWIRPAGVGVQLSRNGSWFVIGTDDQGNITINNSISTKKIVQAPAHTKKKTKINIGIGN